jgi:thymidylate synthase (FAD)
MRNRQEFGGAISTPSSDQGEDSEHLSRSSVPALDEVLGRKFRVLDDGFVCVVDYMGSDSAIVQAARVSYGAGTKRVQDDRILIRFIHTRRLLKCAK